MARPWRMELPPSLGREPMRARARELAALLYDVGFGMVATADTYEALEERVLAGDADAAWAPPVIAARVARAGGRVALRALRDGAATYRSVLVVRAHDSLRLDGPIRRRPRAAWVDRASMAGYLLPRAFMRSLGLDLAEFLVDEHFLGSYEKCLEAVLEGKADLTATFAGPSSTMGDGFVHLAGRRATELRALAYSAECPNDAIVLSPKLAPLTADAMQTALRRLLGDPRTSSVFSAAFDVSGFDEPPPDAYGGVLDQAERGA